MSPNERFMRHHYGASGYTKKADQLHWQDAFEKWWALHGANYPDEKSFARWIWSAAWNEREEKRTPKEK